MISKLSLGDARAYYLSTAKNELGVVSAQSIAGMKGHNPICLYEYMELLPSLCDVVKFY